MSCLPNIATDHAQIKDYMSDYGYINWQAEGKGKKQFKGKNAASASSSPTDNSPTTISKSYFTRGMSDGATKYSMAAKKKRVQSAVNKRSK